MNLMVLNINHIAQYNIKYIFFFIITVTLMKSYTPSHDQVKFIHFTSLIFFLQYCISVSFIAVNMSIDF